MGGLRKFIVLQTGARMHYAVPTLLAKAGMLQTFYTDIHSDDWLIKYGFGWWPSAICPKPLHRLLSRTIPTEARDRTRSVAASAVLHRVGFRQVDNSLRKRLLKDGFADANALYSLNNRDLPVVRAAKKQSLFIVHEQILNPDVGRILRDERELFPGIEVQESAESVRRDENWDEEQWKEADLLLAPSEFVQSGMFAMGADPAKISIVPYGIGADWLNTTPRSMPGRVLFVGTVGLRKGNHYLAQARKLVERAGARAEFRVVGPISENIRKHTLFAGPTYLGQIPRNQVKEEFLSADIFVLPTISESFGLVHLEAMACGLPVITTPNCGSVVRDGVDGFIVPVRDAPALSEKIFTLLHDRDLRAWMGQNARERATQFSWDMYQRRLLLALESTNYPKEVLGV